jgi:hypothetical protein
VSALADLVGRGLLRTNDADELATLLRRHSLLAQLEAAQVESEPPPLSAVAPLMHIVEDVVFDESDDDRADDELDRRYDAEHAAVDDGRDDDGDSDAGDGDRGVVAEITPKRPEPFLPARQPEHPEVPMPAVAAMAGGTASPVPAAASYIERDPSVNKSLLLRLIAGVRGL